MDKFKLGPPLDWRFLRKVTTTLRQEGWADPGNVAGWLARHPTAEQMIEAIRDAWLGTSLPPREWAAGIDGVEVWCLRDDLGLGVHVSHDSEMTVWQAPPMEPAALEAMAAAFPEALPKLLEELALSVPGLVFDRVGPLAAPAYFATRLGYVTRWVGGTSRKECERLGFEYPDPKRHLIEVCGNGIGDRYVLGTNDSVYFFDHEACGLVRCSVRLEELVEQYFASPQAIVDPYGHGQKWAEEPRETPSAEPLPDPPALALSKKGKQLSHLAGIALAVRGCMRAMPGEHLPGLPRRWARGNAAVLGIIARCKEVAVSGMPLSGNDAAKAHAEIKRIWTTWNVRVKWQGGDYYAAILMAYAMPALLRACSQPADVTAVHEAVAWCETIMTNRPHDNSAALAGIHDADYLLSLELGAPATMGKPVPPEFFGRPLWPDDSLLR